MINLQKALLGITPSASDQHRAERFNRDMARREAGNFYWGFISLGHHERMAIYALYNFARQVDDEADGSAAANEPVENLPQRLKRHRERISRAVRGDYGDDPILRVLAEAIERYSIPEEELQMLVDGVEMDFSHQRYQTFDDLRTYCNLVASVVGRMCVRIFGFSDPVALQTRRRSRPRTPAYEYSPRRTRGRGRHAARVPSPRRSAALRRAGGIAVRRRHRSALDRTGRVSRERARGYFASGYEVLRYIPRRPAACVHTMAGIYEELLKKIERDPALPLRARAALSKTEKLRVVVRSWLSSSG